jgi:hypothetical protein
MPQAVDIDVSRGDDDRLPLVDADSQALLAAG